MIPSEQPGSHPPPGHHPMHFSGPPNAKSPSLHKPDVPVRTPPVTSAGMMYGVVADQPRSLSPTSASPEGQVIERLPNPLRRGEPGPSSSPFSRLPPHHQDPSRFMKGMKGNRLDFSFFILVVMPIFSFLYIHVKLCRNILIKLIVEKRMV